MINALIVESGFGYGGSTSYLYSFLKNSDRKKFNYTVAFYNHAESGQIDAIRELGFEPVFLQKRKSVDTEQSAVKLPVFISKPVNYTKYLFRFIFIESFVIKKLISLIRKNDVQFVLLNNDVFFHIPILVAVLLTGTPCVARKSGLGTDSDSKKWLRSLLSRIVDLFVASSKAEHNAHIRNRFPYKNLVTIYEGVDVGDFQPRKNETIRKEFGISAEQGLVVNVSRIDDGKGHMDFVRAADLVVKKIPSARFMIVGDDVMYKDKHLLKELQREVARCGIGKNFIFAGWRSDVRDILQASDIFVHCPDTWKEGMGIATLEAMACGKPLILTDNWGLAETAAHGYNGYVVPIGDYREIANSIVTLLENRDKLEEMSRNSRTRAEEVFNIRTNVGVIEKTILSTLDLREAR